LLEALLVLVLLTLGNSPSGTPTGDQKPLSTFDVAALAATPEPPEPVRPQAAEPEPADIPRTSPADIKVPAPQVALPSPVVSLPAETMAQADLRNLARSPPAKPRGPSGPPAPGGQSDTPLVDGSGPNGERLYAASWYREPYDSELRGYLSTAQPGWALIACQTVEDYRVDHCIAVDEWPSGSRMARAVLAAAWQFKVRPPRVGGQVKVGEWVRIRIDYRTTRQRY
jgi:protein TonB